jgi:CheY-like chemotaxis protein
MEYRVLVVDDSSIQRLIARRFVERWGATVDVACDGIEAATLALSHSYQIVIMDIHHGTDEFSLVETQPNEEATEATATEATATEPSEATADGPKAAKRIRKNSLTLEETPPVFIGCTSDRSEGTKKQCLAAGFVTMVYKPYTLADMNSALAQATK